MLHSLDNFSNQKITQPYIYYKSIKNDKMKSLITFVDFLNWLSLDPVSEKKVGTFSEKEIDLIRRFSNFIEESKLDIMTVGKAAFMQELRDETRLWLMDSRHWGESRPSSQKCPETTLLLAVRMRKFYQLHTIMTVFFNEVSANPPLDEVNQLQPAVNAIKRKYVYGMAGIAQLFGASLMTAHRIKKSGKIDAAITQIGRKIVVDAELALELAGINNSK